MVHATRFERVTSRLSVGYSTTELRMHTSVARVEARAPVMHGMIEWFMVELWTGIAPVTSDLQGRRSTV